MSRLTEFHRRITTVKPDLFHHGDGISKNRVWEVRVGLSNNREMQKDPCLSRETWYNLDSPLLCVRACDTHEAAN